MDHINVRYTLWGAGSAAVYSILYMLSVPEEPTKRPSSSPSPSPTPSPETPVVIDPPPSRTIPEFLQPTRVFPDLTLSEVTMTLVMAAMPVLAFYAARFLYTVGEFRRFLKRRRAVDALTVDGDGSPEDTIKRLHDQNTSLNQTVTAQTADVARLNSRHTNWVFRTFHGIVSMRRMQKKLERADECIRQSNEVDIQKSSQITELQRANAEITRKSQGFEQQNMDLNTRDETRVHDTEIKQQEHRLALQNKDGEIQTLNRRISELETTLRTAKKRGDETEKLMKTERSTHETMDHLRTQPQNHSGQGLRTHREREALQGELKECREHGKSLGSTIEELRTQLDSRPKEMGDLEKKVADLNTKLASSESTLKAQKESTAEAQAVAEKKAAELEKQVRKEIRKTEAERETLRSAERTHQSDSDCIGRLERDMSFLRQSHKERILRSESLRSEIITLKKTLASKEKELRTTKASGETEIANVRKNVARLREDLESAIAKGRACEVEKTKLQLALHSKQVNMDAQTDDVEKLKVKLAAARAQNRQPSQDDEDDEWEDDDVRVDAQEQEEEGPNPFFKLKAKAQPDRKAKVQPQPNPKAHAKTQRKHQPRFQARYQALYEAEYQAHHPLQTENPPNTKTSEDDDNDDDLEQQPDPTPTPHQTSSDPTGVPLPKEDDDEDYGDDADIGGAGATKSIEQKGPQPSNKNPISDEPSNDQPEQHGKEENEEQQQPTEEEPVTAETSNEQPAKNDQEQTEQQPMEESPATAKPSNEQPAPNDEDSEQQPAEEEPATAESSNEQPAPTADENEQQPMDEPATADPPKETEEKEKAKDRAEEKRPRDSIYIESEETAGPKPSKGKGKEKAPRPVAPGDSRQEGLAPIHHLLFDPPPISSKKEDADFERAVAESLKDSMPQEVGEASGTSSRARSFAQPFARPAFDPIPPTILRQQAPEPAAMGTVMEVDEEPEGADEVGGDAMDEDREGWNPDEEVKTAPEDAMEEDHDDWAPDDAVNAAFEQMELDPEPVPEPVDTPMWDPRYYELVANDRDMTDALVKPAAPPQQDVQMQDGVPQPIFTIPGLGSAPGQQPLGKATSSAPAFNFADTSNLGILVAKDKAAQAKRDEDLDSLDMDILGEPRTNEGKGTKPTQAGPGVVPPPPPQECPTTEEEDGWEPVWMPTEQSFCYFNRFTKVSQWENPRVQNAQQPTAPGPAKADSSSRTEKQPTAPGPIAVASSSTKDKRVTPQHLPRPHVSTETAPTVDQQANTDSRAGSDSGSLSPSAAEAAKDFEDAVAEAYDAESDADVLARQRAGELKTPLPAEASNSDALNSPSRLHNESPGYSYARVGEAELDDRHEKENVVGQKEREEPTEEEKAVIAGRKKLPMRAPRRPVKQRLTAEEKVAIAMRPKLVLRSPQKPGAPRTPAQSPPASPARASPRHSRIPAQRQPNWSPDLRPVNDPEPYSPTRPAAGLEGFTAAAAARGPVPPVSPIISPRSPVSSGPASPLSARYSGMNSPQFSDSEPGSDMEPPAEAHVADPASEGSSPLSSPPGSERSYNSLFDD